MPGRGHFIAAIAFAGLLLPASASAATTWTVDPTAAAGCDLSAHVCKTIIDANNQVANGDTIAIKPGAYVESGSITVTQPSITIKAVTPGSVSVTTGSNTANTPVFVLGAATTLDGLSIGAQENGGQAVLVKGEGSTVTRCFLARLLANNQNTPVYQVDPTVATGTNTISSTFVLQAPVQSPGGANPPPAIQGNDTSTLAISDSNIYAGENLGPAVILQGNALNGSTPIANSIVRTSIYTRNADKDGIQFDSPANSTSAKALTLDSALIVGGGNAQSIRATTAAGGLLGLGSAAGGPITISGVHVTTAGAGRAVSLDSGTGTLGPNGGDIDVTFDRSIIHGSTGSTVGPRTTLALTQSDDYNDVPANSAGITTTNVTQTQDAKLFANPAALDFHLRPDAPVIDKGGAITTGGSDKDVDLEPRLNGAATDLGADEFVNKPPRAAIAATTTTPIQNQAVGFDASKSVDPEQSYGGGITSYHWDFGDGQTADTTTPTTSHAFADIAERNVTVTVTDTLGATSGPATIHLVVSDGVPPVISIAKPRKNATLHYYKTTTTKKKVKDPKTGKTVTKVTKKKTRNPLNFAGTAKDDHGVKTVAIAVRRLGSKSAKSAASQCVWLDPVKKTFVVKSCKRPVYFFIKVANGVWSYRIKNAVPIRSASYELAVVATDGSGVTSPPSTQQFKIVK